MVAGAANGGGDLVAHHDVEVGAGGAGDQLEVGVPPNVDNGLTMDLEIKVVGLNIYE